jgi:hypothetical protein
MSWLDATSIYTKVESELGEKVVRVLLGQATPRSAFTMHIVHRLALQAAGQAGFTVYRQQART